jgi:hypothetical protein
VPVLESEKQLVHNSFAFALFLFESGKNDKSHLEYIVRDFWVKVVPHGNMLDYFRTAFPKVKFKIHEAKGIKLGNVEIKVFALLCKVAYGHAEVVECSAYEMLLPVNLDFHHEPCTGGILAMHIKHGISVEPSFAKLLAAQNVDFFNGAFKPISEESIQKEQKEFCASLVGEGFFESEIQRERCKPRKIFNAAGRASLGNRHKTSFEGNMVRGNRIVYNKLRQCRRCNKGINVENWNKNTKTEIEK